MTELFKDYTFWIGAALFLFSVAGILFILRTLNKEEDKVSFFPTPEPSLNLSRHAEPPPPSLVRAPLPGTLPQFTPRVDSTMDIIKETAAEKHAPAPANITLQLARIENQLEKINAGLLAREKNEGAGELRAILESLKKNGPGSNAQEIDEIKMKVDKIYQVLKSFSGSE